MDNSLQKLKETFDSQLEKVFNDIIERMAVKISQKYISENKNFKSIRSHPNTNHLNQKVYNEVFRRLKAGPMGKTIKDRIFNPKYHTRFDEEKAKRGTYHQVDGLRRTLNDLAIYQVYKYLPEGLRKELDDNYVYNDNLITRMTDGINDILNKFIFQDPVVQDIVDRQKQRIAQEKQQQQAKDEQMKQASLDFFAPKRQKIDDVAEAKEPEPKPKNDAESKDDDDIEGTGMKKKTNKWIAYVKQVQQHHNCPYSQALKIAAKSYKK
jgi:hypothetical protein